MPEPVDYDPPTLACAGNLAGNDWCGCFPVGDGMVWAEFLRECERDQNRT